VRASSAGNLVSSSTRESIVTITSKTTTTHTDNSVSHNTRYYYAIIVRDTEDMDTPSSSVSVLTLGAVAMVQNFSDAGPWAIPDLSSLDIYFLNNNFAPDDSRVTNVEYRLRIDDTGDENYFWCEDYQVYLSSSVFAGVSPDNLVYDNLGGWFDNGYDDDPENDSDIYLNWRSTSYFNGENPNQYWGCIVIDTYAGDSGQLDYLELSIYYDAPSSSPGVIALSVPVSAADEEGPSLEKSHPTSAAQGSLDPASTGSGKAKSRAER